MTNEPGPFLDGLLSSAGMEKAVDREASRPRSTLRRLVGAIGRELRDHAFAYGVVAAFLVAGPIAVAMIFPEASPWLGLVGGLVFGVYAALCAVPDKFFRS